MTSEEGRSAAEAWWSTEIIEMRPGSIRLRGYAIEELIGSLTFPEMIWLMLRGELPGSREAALLEHALVAAVDHGPQAPSIAAARMAATCGVGVNGAMASAINMLGDVHGGAGEQCVAFYQAVQEAEAELPLPQAIAAVIEQIPSGYVPGFGHRFHPVDPRAPRLMELVEQAAAEGVVAGRFARIGRAVADHLAERKGRAIPMNIDGATAVVFAELGFAPPLCRGLFVLARSVGILAHAHEQMRQGGRNKGPLPRDHLWRYEGAPARPLPPRDGPRR